MRLCVFGRGRGWRIGLGVGDEGRGSGAGVEDGGSGSGSGMVSCRLLLHARQPDVCGCLFVLRELMAAVRPRLGDVVSASLNDEFLRGLVEDAKALTKGQWVDLQCEACGQKQRQMVQVRDIPKVLAAVKELLEQVEGRPGTAGVEDAGVQLIVERWTASG